MLLVLVLGGALWGIGVGMKAPLKARLVMIGLLYLSVLLGHAILPEGNSLRLATGESAAPWLLIGAAFALILLYRQGLRQLRKKALSKEDRHESKTKPGSFSEVELNRYARHIVLREVGGPGQKALKNASVLVVGAGGLGSPALQYLAAAGVGTIGVVDDDVVDGANLQRQVIHKDAAIGMAKVFSAQAELEAQNPFVKILPYNRRLDEETAVKLFVDYDVILDGTDNFETRYLINAAAAKSGKPLVSGALTQWEGQVSVFDPAQNAPCYQCIFPQAPDAELAPPCSQAGVIGPLPGVIGTLMALETLKLITGAGQVLRGEMLIFDGLYGETRKITLKRRADCPVCSSSSSP